MMGIIILEIIVICFVFAMMGKIVHGFIIRDNIEWLPWMEFAVVAGITLILVVFAIWIWTLVH